MELANTNRVEVAIEYKTRSWLSMAVDLGPGEARELDFVPSALKEWQKGLPVTTPFAQLVR